MNERLKNYNGLTLIVLVITIVILLLLSGITIGTLSGDNGLFVRAKQAKLEMKRGQITEWLNLKLIEEQSEDIDRTEEEIIRETRKNVIEHQDELQQMGKDVKIDEVVNEENGKKVNSYFDVIVDEDVYKVELEGAKFIGTLEDLVPIIDLESITNTTSTITVKVKVRRNDGGKLEYHIKGEDETKYELKEKGTDNTYTFTKLEQNKKYNIKIVAISKYNKTAELLLNKSTGKVADLTTANTTFEYSTKAWTNGNVTVTASTTVTGYTLQTSKDGKTWTNAVTQTFTANGTIYARLWDGTNYGGAASATVTNIDKAKPIVTGATSTTNSIKITATDEASGIIGYAVTTTTTAPTSFTSCTNTKALNVTVQNKTQGTTYYVWVKDQAGNVSASKSTATGKVTDLTTANTTFEYSTKAWTNGNVTVTASTTVTGYTLQTSKDGKTWTNAVTQTFTANGTIYARLWDGTNYGGVASATVTNIDKAKPIVTGATSTTNSIKITATDEASGIIGYAVTTTTTAPTSFTSCTNTKALNVTVNNQKQGTTYYVWVKDQAGNVSASKSTATGTVADLTTGNTTFTYSTKEWTNQDVTVTASTTVTGFTLQTSKDGKNWTNAVTQTFTANGTIYARLWDGTNYGGVASATVTNIDKTKPTISASFGTGSLGGNGQISISSTTENESGIVGYYIGVTNPQTGSVTWNSTKAITVNRTGTWYVACKDRAGNISNVVSSVYYNLVLNSDGATNYGGANVYIKSGTTIGLPTGLAKSGYKADTWSGGITSIYVNGNKNLSPVWKMYWDSYPYITVKGTGYNSGEVKVTNNMMVVDFYGEYEWRNTYGSPVTLYYKIDNTYPTSDGAGIIWISPNGERTEQYFWAQARDGNIAEGTCVVPAGWVLAIHNENDVRAWYTIYAK